jgi:hypothetical protein
VFLGEDLLVWLVLAFGGAMLVGNVLALARPRGEERAPMARTVVMAAVGGVAALWALVSLVGG